MRKTIRIQEIKNIINNKLESPKLITMEKRLLCSILEEILFKTETYKGYSNIYWAKQGSKKWIEDGKPENLGPYYGPEYDRYYY